MNRDWVNRFLLTLLGRGLNQPTLFSNVYISMKKGFWRYQTSWLFLIHYELSENPIFFHSVLGWSRGFGLIQSPPALKQHPEGLTFVNNQFILESTRAEETQFSSQKIRYINNFSLLLLQDLGASSQHWFTLLKSVQHLFTNKPVHAWGIV